MEYTSASYPEGYKNKGEIPIPLNKDMQMLQTTELAGVVTMSDAPSRKHEHINKSALWQQPLNLNKTEEDYLSDRK